MSNVLRKAVDLAVNEPIAVRAAIAAVVNVLVLSGLVSAPFSEEIDEIVEAVLLAAANIALPLSARAKVMPMSRVGDAIVDAFETGAKVAELPASRRDA